MRDFSESVQGPEYYLYQASLSSGIGRECGAWLWLWQGLDLYPEDKSLIRMMKAVSERRPMTPMRVLQGTMEVANQMNTLSLGLRQHGIVAHTLDYSPSYLEFQSDYTWSMVGQSNTPSLNARLRKLTGDLLPYYDLFHFHFGQSLTYDFTDYAMLRQAGKPVVMQHWGSDVRLYSEARKSNPYVKVKKDEDQIKRRLAKLSQHVKHCIVADKELWRYVKDYYPDVHIVPTMIRMDRYPAEPHARSNDKPLVVHAPTSPEIKGTKYVLEAVEALKDKYEFDFRLVEKMSHEQAMKIYRDADLIIDQLHIGSYGLFAVEAMALGKPVICWISDEMTMNYPAELPLLRANPDTITEILEFALRNRDSFPEFGRRGRAYVEAHHDMAKNSATVLSLYRSLL